MKDTILKCNVKLLARLLYLVVPCLAGCGLFRDVESARPNMDESTFRRLMTRVDPWPSHSTNYSWDGWLRLVSVAKTIQRVPHPVMERVFYEYQRKGCARGDFQLESPEQLISDGELFLLMRMVFELPEAQIGPWVTFGKWDMPGVNFSPDAVHNIAWPVRWDHGHPRLESGYVGIEGVNARYNARDEYVYFLKRYAMRDLSLFHFDCGTNSSTP